MKCGETEKQIGGAEREFIHGAAINFLTPFRNFLEGDFKTILVRHTSWNTVSLIGPPTGDYIPGSKGSLRVEGPDRNARTALTRRA